MERLGVRIRVGKKMFLGRWSSFLKKLNFFPLITSRNHGRLNLSHPSVLQVRCLKMKAFAFTSASASVNIYASLSNFFDFCTVRKNLIAPIERDPKNKLCLLYNVDSKLLSGSSIESSAALCRINLIWKKKDFVKIFVEPSSKLLYNHKDLSS